jgi:hypothetical protein
MNIKTIMIFIKILKISIMKTLFKIFFLTALISLVAGCNKTNEFIDDETSELKKAQVTVTVPFEAEFTGDYVYLYLKGQEGMGDCADEFRCRVGVEFQGTGTHLGKFTGYFDFCACGPGGKFGPTVSEMVAANGDILYVSCWGYVKGGRQSDHPEHVVSYWRDPFIILGGTGRFEGATGGGMTDDYNSSLDPNSHHHWTGTITLVKGKK